MGGVRRIEPSSVAMGGGRGCVNINTRLDL